MVELRSGIPTEVKQLIEAITEHLENEGLLNMADLDVIEMTAYAIYRMRQARKALDDEGLLVWQGEKRVKNPAMAIEKDYQKIFWQGCQQLGLSPMSRAKLER